MQLRVLVSLSFTYLAVVKAAPILVSGTENTVFERRETGAGDEGLVKAAVQLAAAQPDYIGGTDASISDAPNAALGVVHAIEHGGGPLASLFNTLFGRDVGNVDAALNAAEALANVGDAVFNNPLDVEPLDHDSGPLGGVVKTIFGRDGVVNLSDLANTPGAVDLAEVPEALRAGETSGEGAVAAVVHVIDHTPGVIGSVDRTVFGERRDVGSQDEPLSVADAPEADIVALLHGIEDGGGPVASLVGALFGRSEVGARGQTSATSLD